MSYILDCLESLSLEAKNLAKLSTLIFQHADVASEREYCDAMDLAWYLSSLMFEHEKKLNELPEILLKGAPHTEVEK